MLLCLLSFVGGFALCSAYSSKIVKEQKNNIFKKGDSIK